MSSRPATVSGGAGTNPFHLSKVSRPLLLYGIFAPRRLRVPVRTSGATTTRLGWTVTDRISFEIAGEGRRLPRIPRKRLAVSVEWRVELELTTARPLGERLRRRRKPGSPSSFQTLLIP